MEQPPQAGDIKWPKPPLSLALLAIIISGIAVYAPAHELDYSPFALVLVPIVALASIACYLALLRLQFRRDPRIWLDPKAIGELLQDAYPRWWNGGGAQNTRFIDVVRARLWHEGTRTIATQTALTAASSASMSSLAQENWMAALALFIATYAMTRIIVQTTLASPDREAMRERLNSSRPQNA